MENGQPVPESVSVSLQCPTAPTQLIHTDLKGYFQFTLGGGAQGNNQSYDASNNQMPTSAGGGSGKIGNSRMLTGCDVKVSVAGYQPLSKTITDRDDIGGIDVGTLQLTRLAGVSGTSISVTSLQVPNLARKEYEKGEKDVRNRHFDAAAEHLQNAVNRYDKYAAAWNELGNVYVETKRNEKARDAYGKSIEADPHYVPPEIALAQLELQNKEFEPAVESAGKALALDPGITVADFIQAVADFNLNRLDAAEKSAELAEKGPHQSMPDLHALHAQILLAKHDYPGAAAQMRAYLQEVPQGRFAEGLRKDLRRIEQSGAEENAASNSARLENLQTASSPQKTAAVLIQPTPPTSPELPFPLAIAPGATLNSSPTSWIPPDIDTIEPAVDTSVGCSLPQVVNGVGQRITEFIDSLQKFDATETIEHFNVDSAGTRGNPQIRTFDYVAAISSLPSGSFQLDEYRNGSLDPSQFPAGIATLGLPSLAMIFHPNLVSDFSLTCEGLGEWNGHPTWQIHFSQRADRPSRIREYVIAEHHYPVPLKGRAWIDADTYQIQRMETDLMKPVEGVVSITHDRTAIDYGPVQFQAQKRELWLPQEAELYVERNGHRYYRHLTYGNFKIFAVESSEHAQAPKESYCFLNTGARDVKGTLTILPVSGSSAKVISIRLTIPSGEKVCKLVGLGQNINIPTDEVDSASFLTDGPSESIIADASVVRVGTLESAH